MQTESILKVRLNTLSAIALLIAAAVSGAAQSQSQYDKGTPPQHRVGVSAVGSYISTELGTINLSNGALNFRIPLATVGGRGDVSFPITLNYSSKVWSASIDTDFTVPENPPVAYADFDAGLAQGGSVQTMIGAGWSIGFGPTLEAKRVQIGKITDGPNAGCYSYTLTKLTLYLPDRGEIELRDDATNGAPLPSVCTAPGSRGTRWHATDGSGIVFINDVDNGVAQLPAPDYSGVVITAEGTRIRFGANGGITDRNGNKITSADPLGRTITIQQNVSDPENPYGPLAWLITVKGYQGQNRYYKIKTGMMHYYYRTDINPSWPVITGDWDPESRGYNWWGENPTRLFEKSYGLYAQQIDDLEVLTELVLPGGRSLRFRYNEYGEVAEVQLPTGAKIQYDHSLVNNLPTGNSPLWETGTGGTGHSFSTDVRQVDRGVTEKRTYPDGVNLEGTWNYGYSGSTSSVTVRSSANVLLLSEIHYFLSGNRYTEYPYSPGSHDGTHYNVWSTGLEWRTEVLNASGAVIAATEQDWTQRMPVSWVGYPTEQPAQDNRVDQARKYLNTGIWSKVETLYDQYNNPTEVKEFDFDQSLKRRTVTAYITTNNGYNYTDDFVHLLRLPSQQSVYDGAGVEKARTVYEYDNYTSDGLHAPLVDYGTVTQHDPTYNASKTTRGNATAVGRWLNTTNTTIWTYQRYDKLGNIISLTDARGNVSTISFTDDFGNGSNPGSGSQGTYGATYAFPTLVTSPPPQPGEPVHTARSQYDFSTGLLTGFRDRNDVITQTIYEDSFNRPTLTKAALGVSGVETHTRMYYAPMTTSFGITLANNDVLTASDKDALDDQALRSWTVTDGFGRTKESWARDPQGNIKTATNYDALSRAVQTSNPFRPSLGESAAYTTKAFDLAGREVLVTTPDNAAVTTSYSGNMVTVADQANKQRKSVTDALGRLVQVYEAPNDPTHNYATSYTYDALDNLTTIIQSEQTRSFVYDSLKRLISATNPESGTTPQNGTTTYTYDHNSNLISKTDARSVTTSYSYDALNRLYDKSASDNTPTEHHRYDTYLNGKGRLAYIFVPGANSSMDVSGYDALGRPLGRQQAFYNGTQWKYYQSSYAYDLAGNVKTIWYPSNNRVDYTYDTASRLQSFSGNLGAVQRTYSSAVTYSPFGGLSKEQFGTDTTLYHNRRYNIRGQLFDVRVGSGLDASSELTRNRGVLQWFYASSGWGQSGSANNGNITASIQNIPTDDSISGQIDRYQEYQYDSLNRLTSVAESHGQNGGTPSPAYTQAYVYDRFGNRTINASLTSDWINEQQFTVNTANNRLGVPPGQNKTMTYDAAGNLIYDDYSGGGSRTYDAENRMKTAVGGLNQELVYTYDGEGHRVRRKVNGVETWQVYGLSGELLAEYPADGAASSPQKEYGYRNGELLITAVPGGSSAGPAATFLQTDATTQGDWKGVYGGDGYNVINNAVSYPAYAQVSVTGQNAHTWVDPTADVRGLEKAATTDHLAACWYSGSNFTIDLNLTDGNEHELALYVLDWDGNNTRATRIEVLNAASNAVLDSRDATSFSGGKYFVWSLRGHVKIKLSNIGGSNAVLSGLFFDPVAGGGSSQNVSWTNAQGVSVSGNSLTKTEALGWGNAGASSTQTLASGDGYVEFTGAQLGTDRICGLSNGDTNQDWIDIDFGLYLRGDNVATIVESGNYSPQYYVSFAAGDVFRVSVESGVVKYKKNGVVFYTSGQSPNYPLNVDTALYTGTITNVVVGGNWSGSGGGASVINWLVSDQLGTPRIILDQTGSWASTKRHDYLPFGEELHEGVGNRTASQGYVTDSVRQKFTSKERDGETGLDYFLARYYSSTQGRFTSPDEFSGGADEYYEFHNLAAKNPTFYADLTDPQSLNKYHYAYNNPLLYTDPDGHQGVREYFRRGWDSVRSTAGSAKQTIRETINGAASTVSENNGFGRLNAPQNKVGRAAGHGLSLVQSGAEIVGGLGAIGGGAGEAVVTAPAAATGVGVVVPSAGVITATVGVIAVGHGSAVGVNTLLNIFSKGKDGHPAQDKTTVQGTQDQLDDITANQANQRKAGKPDAIRSTGKSKQRADQALKKVGELKDVEP